MHHVAANTTNGHMGLNSGILIRNGRESPRQSKEEIERESNYEWLGFELGLPTFPFRGYIRRRLGVLWLDWFVSWSWKLVLQSSVQDHLTNEVPPGPLVLPALVCGGLLRLSGKMRFLAHSYLSWTPVCLPRCFIPYLRICLVMWDLLDWTSGLRGRCLTDQEYAVIWKTSAVLHLVVYSSVLFCT